MTSSCSNDRCPCLRAITDKTPHLSLIVPLKRKKNGCYFVVFVRQSHSYKCLGIGRAFTCLRCLRFIDSRKSLRRLWETISTIFRSAMSFRACGLIVREDSVTYRSRGRTVQLDALTFSQANQNETNAACRMAGTSTRNFSRTELMKNGGGVDDIVCCRKLCNPTPPICHVVIWSERKLIRL